MFGKSDLANVGIKKTSSHAPALDTEFPGCVSWAISGPPSVASLCAQAGPTEVESLCLSFLGERAAPFC